MLCLHQWQSLLCKQSSFSSHNYGIFHCHVCSHWRTHRIPPVKPLDGVLTIGTDRWSRQWSPLDGVLTIGTDRWSRQWKTLIGCWELGQTDDSGLREAPWWGVDNWDRQMILAYVKPPDGVLRTGADRRFWLTWSPLIGCWELGQTDDSGLREAPWWGVDNWDRQMILACVKPPDRVLRTGADWRFWLTWSPLIGCWELGQTDDSGLYEAPW